MTLLITEFHLNGVQLQVLDVEGYVDGSMCCSYGLISWLHDEYVKRWLVLLSCACNVRLIREMVML